MTEIRRVLLVEPLEGARWRSISAYSASLQGILTEAGIDVDVASAPWFNPPSIVRAATRRWTRQLALRKAEQGAYDLVHLTDHALAHHAARFLPRSPVAVTCHDLMPFTTRGYYRSRVEAATKRAFLRRPTRALAEASAVTCVSEFTRAELCSRLRPAAEATAVVPNLVRPAFRSIKRAAAERRLAEMRMTLPPGPRVLSVGNDRAYKNLPALFRALGRPSLAHASLVRVGAPLAAADQGLARELAVLRRTFQLGDVSDEALALVYAACDVLAQPSLAEGFGVPVVEAMACGCPAVTSDGGALPEVGGGAALSVPLSAPDFPGALAEALVRAMRDAPEISRAGLERARAFQPGTVLPALLNAYQRAADRWPG